MPCRATSVSEVVDLGLRARLMRTCVRYGGVGVAAPQIGIELQAVLVNYEETTRFMLNPEIVEVGEESSEYHEGCLSWPLSSAKGIKSYQGGKVSRPDKITVKYLADTGEETVEEFTEFLAHIVAHEVDHCSGKFYVEYLSPIQRRSVMTKYRHFRKRFVVA